MTSRMARILHLFRVLGMCEKIHYMERPQRLAIRNQNLARWRRAISILLIPGRNSADRQNALVTPDKCASRNVWCAHEAQGPIPRKRLLETRARLARSRHHPSYSEWGSTLEERARSGQSAERLNHGSRLPRLCAWNAGDRQRWIDSDLEW